MMRRHCVRFSGIVALLGAGAAPGAQQEGASPETVVALNEGIYHYLQGERDEGSLAAAIERFTSVIDREPDNPTALLFRALSYGQLGLLVLEEKQRHQRIAAAYDRVLEARADPQRLKSIEQDIEDAEATLADETATEAEHNIARALRDHHRQLLRVLELEKGKSADRLETARQDHLKQTYVTARTERDDYLKMIDDLKHVIGVLDHPEAVIRLLNVVANAKVARIDEEEARGVVRKEVARGDAGGPVKALRAASAARLAEAADTLEALLSGDVDELTRVRTSFFLGVIHYRQGAPLRDKTESPASDEPARMHLKEAERVMARLADDPATEDTWRSYAALYLGIIIPFRAAAEGDADERNRILDEAERRLTQAADLDATVKDRRSTIPDLVWRQRRMIAGLRKAAPAARPRNDLSLSLYGGSRWDSNVVLLGERTDLPRDISRERDFGFTAGAALDYTWDISERVTLGLQARTSQLWNVDVHEFDQQTYGGSVALQYQALRQRGDAGPMYWALQYDGDYTLLGRLKFLESHTLTPSWRMYWARQRAQTDVFFTYEIRDYSEPLFDRRLNRTGTYLTLGASQRIKAVEMTAVYRELGWEPWGCRGDESLAQDDPDYPQRYITPFVTISRSWDATVGDEFDRKAAALVVGVDMPLPWGVDLDASALFEWERYPQGSLIDFHRRRRRDFVQEYGLGLSRTFVLREGLRENRYTPAFDRLLMTVRAHATWTDDDSNVLDRPGQAIFEYDRLVFGLSVAFTFN